MKKNIIAFPDNLGDAPGFRYLDSMKVLCANVQEIAESANITVAEVLTDLMYLVISKDILETIIEE